MSDIRRVAYNSIFRKILGYRQKQICNTLLDVKLGRSLLNPDAMGSFIEQGPGIQEP